MIDDDRRPPECVEELMSVALRHFPNLSEDSICDPKGLGRKQYSVFALVSELDDDLRRCCFRIATYGLDEAEAATCVEYGQKHKPAVILRGLENAVNRGDRAAYAGWLRKESEAVRRLIDEAKTDVTGDDSWTLSEMLERTLGTSHRTRLSEVYQRAAELAGKAGRRRDEWQDKAVLRCAETWMFLSGKPLKQPSHIAGASSRAGSMVAFVDDALAVFSDYGLRPSPSSGAAWARILPAKDAG